MGVGNINSDKPGSGARYNDGKLAMDLIPVSFWRRQWRRELSAFPLMDALLLELHKFQEGDLCAPGRILDMVGDDGLCKATAVLEYGVKKYAAWNWAKGMNWSVPTGCILRHVHAILFEDEKSDSESGLPHFSHVVCNVVMLAYYITHYREGDDRPPCSRDMPE